MAIHYAPVPVAQGAAVVPYQPRAAYVPAPVPVPAPPPMPPSPPPPPALPMAYAAAVDRYLAAARMAKSSAWIHRMALTTWGWMFSGQPAPIGPARRAATPEPFALGVLGEPGLAPVVAELAAARAEALDVDTVRRELAIVRRAIAWWLGKGWLTFDPTVGIERRPAPRDPTRPLAGHQIEALWRLNVSVREMTFWKLLHESGERADEVLCLNVEHLRPAQRYGSIVAGGGAIKWIRWGAGTAELLPLLVGGRGMGPLFLSGREASGMAPARDRCPLTGKGRLTYRRAEELFEKRTRLLANPLARSRDIDVLEGWRPLHRLRPSAYSPFALM
jgi:integrase/recombinase XerD